MKTALRMALLSTALAVVATTVWAQQITNSSPPFTRVDNYLKLPGGRHMGSTNTIAADSKGNLWIAERCGANECKGSPLDPILEFDAQGNFIKSFGAGKVLFPHFIWIDKSDNIWIVDGHGNDVQEFDPNGKILMTLGTPGQAGNDKTHFDQPSSVLVAPDGSIFVGDGHEQDKANSRIVKFDKTGKYVKEWGGHGRGPGQMDIPHCLAMDSKGLLYLGDRGNNRIDVFTQDGKFIKSMDNFGRPSGCFIDSHDNLYVADSESHLGHHPGWVRGVRIGALKDGVVTAFIPDDKDVDPEKMGTSNGEGIYVDAAGNIYDAEVGQKAIVRYAPKSGT
jgi:sugar lactone lactonase YvrE